MVSVVSKKQPIRNMTHIRFILLMLAVTMLVYEPNVLAKLPEPANVIYGKVAIGDVPLTDENTEVVISLKINDIIFASYRMGDRAGMGDRYLLNVPMDAEGVRSPNTARKGDVATIYVSGIEAGTFTIGEMGQLTLKNLTIASDDYDNDGMPDAFEALYGLAITNDGDALEDPDQDGLTNLEEFLAGTDPYDADTDNDGMTDGYELAHGFNPLNSADANQDADGDGYTNLEEFNNHTDPELANTKQPFRIEFAASISAHNGNIAALAVEDEKILSASQHESVIKTWNLNDGQYLRQSESNSQNGINALTIDGSSFFAGTGGAAVSQFSLDTGYPIQTLTQVQGSILALAVYDDQLIGGSADGSVNIWSISNGALLETWNAHNGSFISGLEATNGKLYTLGTFPYKSMKIWDWNTKNHLLTFQGAETCCQLTNLHLKEGKLLISGFQSPDQISAINLNNLDSQMLTGHLNEVVALSAANHRFFSGDEEGKVNVWGMNGGDVLQSFQAHGKSIRSVAATDDYLVTGDNGGQIKIWKLYGDASGDIDEDGMSDDWEVVNLLDPSVSIDNNLDSDNDGLLNIYEYINQTDPQRADTDNDQLPDGWEVAYGFNPRDGLDTDGDPDGDGFNNLQEFQNGTDPFFRD